MSKKYVVLLLMLCISCFFVTGCGDVTELTDEETKLIAEYAAEVLLRYDINYDDRINEGEKIQAELDEAEESGDDIAEPVTEESSTEQQDLSDNDVTDNAKQNADDSSEEDHNRDYRITDNDSSVPAENDIEDDSAGNESDIGKILGFDGISITYKDYIITDQYPATDEDGQFIYLEASEGYQLLVVRFNVSNTSNDAMNLTMMDEDIDYRIVCNNKRAANPMLTILMNDLGTLETTLDPGENQEGVLVFQISNDMESKLESMELKVEHNNTENIINIL